MYCKKLVILLVSSLIVPIVSSQGVFECSDGSDFGKCNEGIMCSQSVNLLDGDFVNLNFNEKYLFFGRNNCDSQLEIGNRIFNLIETEERSVVEFDGFDFNGGIGLPCEDNYLGIVSGSNEVYNDCNYCGSCVEEVLEICPDFNNDNEVNFEDYFLLADSFGLEKGDEFYRGDIDLDKDAVGGHITT